MSEYKKPAFRVDIRLEFFSFFSPLFKSITDFRFITKSRKTISTLRYLLTGPQKQPVTPAKLFVFLKISIILFISELQTQKVFTK